MLGNVLCALVQLGRNRLILGTELQRLLPIENRFGILAELVVGVSDVLEYDSVWFGKQLGRTLRMGDSSGTTRTQRVGRALVLLKDSSVISRTSDSFSATQSRPVIPASRYPCST